MMEQAVVFMKLYLVQHATARRKEEDPSRPLSEQGWREIVKVAEYSAKYLDIHVEQILHSSKLRAKQTAEVLAEHLQPTKGAVLAQYLEPLADPKFWQRRLAQARENTIIVGHLPHLSKLTSILLTGDEAKEVVAFRMAGIVCLQRNETNQWVLKWLITPEIVP